MALSANPDAASPSTARCRTSVTFGGVLARHAVAFAKALIEARGRVSDAQFAAVKDTGWTDANIVEMIALTAQFLANMCPVGRPLGRSKETLSTTSEPS